MESAQTSAPAAAAQIGIKVKESGGGSIDFRVRATTTMARMMDAYCKHKAIDKDAVVFLFDGNRVRPEDTPEALGMENGDTLDVMFHQVGGSGGGGNGGQL